MMYAQEQHTCVPSNLVPGTLILAGLVKRLPLLSYLYADLRLAKLASIVSLRACLESLQVHFTCHCL